MAPRPGGYVVLAVSGTGSGMEDRTRTRIFEPFVTAANEGRGTGLGFATIQGIVRQNSGDMVVEGGAGSGTTLKVYLPRTEEAQETEPPLQSDPAGGAETVLVVEDEWEVQNLLVKVLRATGYNVLAAKDSAEALDLSGVYAGPIHLLITDVVIPGISGCELAQALSRGRPELKVLYISGYAEEVVARHGIVDPDQFLQKPFRLDELMQKIRLSLDQPNTPS
jgi:CheY-like chemotaxis protein